mgnify:CR=1 FL=1
MIKKVYRLNETEVKKVLKYWKPFFSYGIVSNSAVNKLPYNRFAIIIWGKSVTGSISRNFFRRKFYDETKDSITKVQNNTGKDIVFVIKKQTKLDKKDFESIKLFEKDVNFLLYKI